MERVLLVSDWLVNDSELTGDFVDVRLCINFSGWVSHISVIWKGEQ